MNLNTPQIKTGPLTEADFQPSEAAHAASEYTDDEPEPLTVPLWKRVTRAVRAWWIDKTWKP